MGFVVRQRSGQLQQLSGRHRDLAALTTREPDVTRAIAAGMSNAEIAEKFVISEWGRQDHVASILRKLGLRDRTQVAVAAHESGLVRPGTTPDGA
jgi:DNA-binding NarL/FixJ family response regulator